MKYYIKSFRYRKDNYLAKVESGYADFTNRNDGIYFDSFNEALQFLLEKMYICGYRDRYGIYNDSDILLFETPREAHYIRISPIIKIMIKNQKLSQENWEKIFKKYYWYSVIHVLGDCEGVVEAVYNKYKQ